MQYISHYDSPLGRMLLAADQEGLTGAWFEGQKYFARSLDREHEERKLPVFDQAVQWLEVYFSGRSPEFAVALHPRGTAFQKEVWKILLEIPYGETRTYGEIAAETAARMGRSHMSAQAVGGAVGHNPISIFIPCHRAVGAGGRLTGYAGGLDKKEKLLRLEKS